MRLSKEEQFLFPAIMGLEAGCRGGTCFDGPTARHRRVPDTIGVLGRPGSPTSFRGTGCGAQSFACVGCPA